ncbi:MAG: glycosyltransferase family 39 protein [Anaerolineae bacterium]|nr:glycosyltransferase family 39 protein [Anaerolineae bacterium]
MKSSIFQKIKRTHTPQQYFVAVLLFLGIILRLRQYLTGRSLWLDEAMLALNIVNRDFVDLFQPLDYDQGAPIGFLLIEKILNVLFGDHEFVFRLFPLVTGIAALIIFYLLLRHVTSGLSLLVGLTLFAFGPELIYYSSEVKQYIVDVLVTVGLLYLTSRLLEGKAQNRNYIFLSDRCSCSFSDS